MNCACVSQWLTAGCTAKLTVKSNTQMNVKSSLLSGVKRWKINFFFSVKAFETGGAERRKEEKKEEEKEGKGKRQKSFRERAGFQCIHIPCRVPLLCREQKPNTRENCWKKIKGKIIYIFFLGSRCVWILYNRWRLRWLHITPERTRRKRIKVVFVARSAEKEQQSHSLSSLKRMKQK